MAIAKTPAAPYYAVIFTSLRTEGESGYGKMAEAMEELAATQPGFLGIESARDGLGITFRIGRVWNRLRRGSRIRGTWWRSSGAATVV
jgi:antibiotic biosynthesis monooxygenase (ABM) superfamily enzyme